MDDALDVFAVHGIGGIWGAIATGIFAVAVITGGGDPAEGVSGLIEGGNIKQVGIQAVAAFATLIYSGVVSFVILFILDKIPGLGLRASESDEDLGLDLASHGEQATVRDGAD